MPVSATQRWQTMFLCRTVKRRADHWRRQYSRRRWLERRSSSDNNKSVYSVGDKNAISLRDNATIHIKKTPLSPTQPTGTLAILAPAPILSKSVPVLRSLLTAQCKSMVRRIWAKRSTCMAVAIRSLSTVQSLLKKRGYLVSGLTGTGNDSRNSVINNGLIQRTDGGNVIGTSGGNGIDFTNNGTVNGSLFAKGDDN
ncbi:MAG: hypothetical protein ACLR2G_00715 [Phascolarctobacterium faecium]